MLKINNIHLWEYEKTWIMRKKHIFHYHHLLWMETCGKDHIFIIAEQYNILQLGTTYDNIWLNTDLHEATGAKAETGSIPTPFWLRWCLLTCWPFQLVCCGCFLAAVTRLPSSVHWPWKTMAMEPTNHGLEHSCLVKAKSYTGDSSNMKTMYPLEHLCIIYVYIYIEFAAENRHY